MRKFVLLLFFIPAWVYAGMKPGLIVDPKTPYLAQGLFISKSIGNCSLGITPLTINFSPTGIPKKKLPKAFYPWGVAATAVIVGGGVAYYGAYKEILPLAISGGTVAVAGGILAAVSLSPLRKYVGLASINGKNKNTIAALGPTGIYLSHRF